MKNRIIVFLLLLFSTGVNAQYNKEKIVSILTSDSEQKWDVTGINTVRNEKAFTFNKSGSVITESKSGAKKNEKWSVRSSDNIRWFLSLGADTYELIVSYDKSGNQYIKLTHQEVDNKTSGYYEIKLTPVKK